MECIVLLLFVGWYWVMQQLYWRLCLVMECIVLLLFVGWYWVMQQLYWRLCLVMECIVLLLFVGWYGCFFYCAFKIERRVIINIIRLLSILLLFVVDWSIICSAFLSSI